MIADKLENAELYYGLGSSYKKAFEYLKTADLKNLENGRYNIDSEIDGEEIYVSIQDYNTKPENEGRFEAHKKYTDIQFIIKGEEKLGFGSLENFRAVTFYDEKNDIVFLENTEKENHSNQFVSAKENYFVIFTPQDAHMPCITDKKPSYVKKAVVKIKNI